MRIYVIAIMIPLSTASPVQPWWPHRPPLGRPNPEDDRKERCRHPPNPEKYQNFIKICPIILFN